MSEECLPDCRENLTQRVIIGGAKVYLTLGFFDPEKQRIGELFLVVQKTGSEERWYYDEIARLASKLLQYGCPVEQVAEGWLGTKGKIAGPVEGYAAIKFCTSVLDCVARLLLIEWCGRKDLAHG